MLVILGVRYLLVALFFPFSALDKLFNFRGAVGQAEAIFRFPALARGSILVGLCIEIVMPIGILTGTADRLAALILALYCLATAILFKPFWRPGDFWYRGDSKGRDLFWDFLKNCSLAGGFLLITFATSAHGVHAFVAHPFGSTHPYAAYRGS